MENSLKHMMEIKTISTGYKITEHFIYNAFFFKTCN